MTPSPSDLSVATLVQGHKYLSFLYYSKIAWSYLAVAFLLGSIPFGLIVGRVFFKTDIRGSGSGNIGAANAARTFGRAGGIAVLLLDMAKGLAAVLIPRFAIGPMIDAHASAPLFAPPLLPYTYSYGNTALAVTIAVAPLCALAAVLGHCYSPWLGGKGGKGVATFLGCLCGLGYISVAIFALAWLLIIARTGFASLASIVATTAVAIYVTWRNFTVGDGDVAVVFVLGALAVIVLRHRANISRLLAGDEPKLKLGRPQGPAESRGKRAPTL